MIELHENNIEEFNPFEEMSFSYDRCFICGEKLSSNNTVEHIYPKWLQNDFDLWNKQLVLLNGTSIQYRNMVVPCCFECNEIMSRKLEKPVKEAVQKGYDEFINLDRKVIFQWLNKISYGALFKELSLKRELRNPNSEAIYTEENLKKHKMQYLFLKSTVQETKYVNNPWSILIFKVKKQKDKQYWVYDNPFVKTYFMLLNDIGIIAHLMDNGCNQDFFMQFPHMVELMGKELHPIQFYELCARFHYKSALLKKSPFYINMFDKNNGVDTIISHGIDGTLYAEWDNETYSHILEFFLEPYKVKFEEIYLGKDKVITYIRNEDGSFKDMSKL